ncbi:TlpA disulfide reductase family protein [Confluentibacter sediminis]|uniref:TlpA disulfide reductase family protein n=1 Tax=Confluentibacter sediminis TaxID=2219045 RepID=UPI000DAE7F18|nr:TlpA disulfide reductase family protein [Confluentibacter sediminis]
MRKYLLLLLFTSLISACKHNDSTWVEYTIKGEISSDIKADIAVMSYPENDKGEAYKSDTTAIKNGKFEFKGTIGRPQLAELNLIALTKKVRDSSQIEQDGSTMKNVALIYLDGTIDVSFDSTGIASYSGGGGEEKAWQAYAKMSETKSKALKGDQITMAFYENLVTDFVKSHPDRYVSVDLMDLFTTGGAINLNLVEPMYEVLSDRMKNTPKIVALKPRLDEAKKFESGEIIAADFTMNDPEGNPVSFASYKGKYLLLDFWASWCAPCRAENPNVLNAYKKFKDKNFTILAVSIDSNKEAWLKAIKEDSLPWKQVSDLKGADNEAAKLYGVSVIPDNFLIDKNGKIIGRGLKGQALQQKLAELIK